MPVELGTPSSDQLELGEEGWAEGQEWGVAFIPCGAHAAVNAEGSRQVIQGGTLHSPSHSLGFAHPLSSQCDWEELFIDGTAGVSDGWASELCPI